jgi:lipoprotein signal peptidase
MWPVFNVADAALLVGVIFLILAGSLTWRKIAA